MKKTKKNQNQQKKVQNDKLPTKTADKATTEVKPTEKKYIKSTSKYKTADYVKYIPNDNQLMFTLFIAILLNAVFIFSMQFYLLLIGVFTLLVIIGAFIFNLMRTRKLYLVTKGNPDINFTFLDKKIDIEVLSDKCNEKYELEYEKIIKAIEKPDLIYLCISNNSFFVVYKYEMVEGSTNELITLLRAKLGYKYRV